VRRIFGLKKEKVAAVWRRLHNEELQNLHAPSNIIRTKNSRTGWAGKVERMGDMKRVYTILVRKPEGKRHSEDLGVDGRIILE